MSTKNSRANALVERGGQIPMNGDINAKAQVASADGAITIKEGTIIISKAGVAALTLADPTATADDGKKLTIISVTANAHTVSNAAGSGFNGGGAASDVGTFGGAKGDNFQVIAYQGVWYVNYLRNVTLG